MANGLRVFPPRLVPIYFCNLGQAPSRQSQERRLVPAQEFRAKRAQQFAAATNQSLRPNQQSPFVTTAFALFRGVGEQIPRYQ